MLFRLLQPSLSAAVDVKYLTGAAVHFRRCSDGGYYADLEGPDHDKALKMPRHYAPASPPAAVVEEIKAAASRERVTRVIVDVVGGEDFSGEAVGKAIAAQLGGDFQAGIVRISSRAFSLAHGGIPGIPAAQRVHKPVIHATAEGLGLLRDATRNGWDAEDLRAFQGLTDAALFADTVRSATAGLRLSELCLFTPPDGWAEKRAAAWPWEVAGFQPSADWRAPSLPPKARREDRPMAPAVAAESAPPVSDEAPPADAPAEPEIDDALLSWPQSDLVAAVAFLRAQIAGGNALSVTKYNHLAKQHGLRAVNGTQFAALKARASSNPA